MSRDQWLWKNATRLRSFTPSRHEIEFERRSSDGKGELFESYISSDREGLIRFDATNWIYIVMHSGHEDDMIGDASLAVTSSGEFYQNLGHICGRYVYISRGKPPSTSYAEFVCNFSNGFPNSKWAPVSIPDPPALNKRIQELLDKRKYAKVLSEMPDVKEAWKREQELIDQLNAIGCRFKMQRIGNPRLVLSLPKAYGKYFDRVVEVSAFRSSKVTDSTIALISSFQHLQYLDITGCKVEGLCLGKLEGLLSLRSIGLSENPLTAESYRQLGRLTQIMSVNLRGTDIDDMQLGSLASLTNLASLRALDTKITLDGARRFRTLCPKAKIYIFPTNHPMYQRQEEINDEEHNDPLNLRWQP